MSLKNKLIILLFIFCLPACAGRQEGNFQTNKNAFAATGLLAHPNETAEEILMRAHKQDQDAAFLAATGYALGIGGFTRNRHLANAWAGEIQTETHTSLVSFFTIMEFHDFKPYNVTFSPKQCYRASQSFAAPLLKDAGIFDLDAICADIGYDDSQPIEADLIFHDYTGKTLVESIDNPMSSKLQKAFAHALTGQSGIDGIAGKEIATAGKKDTSSPERAINLLRFMEQRKAEHLAKEPSLESKVIYQWSIDAVLRMNSLDAYDGLALEVVSKAHQGDTTAARQMAENYRIGGMGFPKNIRLFTAWLNKATADGNQKALDGNVLWDYTNEFKWQAWETAQVGLIYGTPEMKSVFEYIIKKAEKGQSTEELQKWQEYLKKELSRLKESGYQTK